MTHDGIDAWTDLNEQPGTEHHEHRAASYTVGSATPEGGLHQTGVCMHETCECGYTRTVWLTSFKVDAAAWQAPEGAPEEPLEAEDLYANDWKGR